MARPDVLTFFLNCVVKIFRNKKWARYPKNSKHLMVACHVDYRGL